MKEKEFYTCDDRVYCMCDGKSSEITETDTVIIDELINRIENFYPKAFCALKENYSKSSLNTPYYRFLMVRRFIKCNFGNLDTNQPDLDDEGTFNFEKTSCPMRGECLYEGTICMPEFNSRLSEAEMRVMRLYYQNKDMYKIADLLYLSGHTVKNHIRNAYTKLGVHTRGEFITYANKHNLFR